MPTLRASPSRRLREIDEPAHLLVVLIDAAQLLVVGDGLVERDADLERDQLRDAVDVAVRHAERAPDVADHGARRHRAVGRDLRDALAAVALAHVIDDAVASVDAEVDVEVRQRHALGIQEPLEQEIVRERIEIRDAERIGDERADAGAATRSDGNRVGARPRDEVGDDEEVALEAHLADDLDLAREPLSVARRGVGSDAELGAALDEPARGTLLEKLPRRRAVVRDEVGQEHAADVDLERAAPRDLDGVRERLGQIREQLGHLGRRAQILLLAVRSRSTRDRRA